MAIMKTSHKLTLFGLLALIVAALVGLQLTNESGQLVTLMRSRRARGSDQEQLVDQRPLETARKLAAGADTRNERKLAAEAVRVADHEVDLAFASALQSAKQPPKTETAAAKDTEARMQRIDARLTASQEKIKQLTAKAAGAKASQQQSIQQQLELAQAQLALDQDELADAQQDLARAGGDTHSQVQRLFEEHQAGEHPNGNVQSPTASGNPPETVLSSGSLVAEWTNWRALRAKQAELAQAQQEALKETSELARNHDALEQRVQAAQSQKRNLAEQAASLLESGKTTGTDSKHMAAQAVDSLRSLSVDQKELAGLDERIQDFQQLSANYSQWSSLVDTRARAFLHLIIKSGLWIVLIVLLVFLLDRLADQLFTRFVSDRRQLHTLRAVARFAMQAVAVLVILFLIFGPPTQLSTILGLAGAGLTVALKDFVVSFFGWFVLMGRNGIRVGDWVEINGVGGEVVEIGLLRTVLLEAGNWTETGHPTGRQIAFLNSFAVEGNYFNFSTSGQWLWDQLQVFIPSGEDLYPTMEKIQAVVEKETADDTKTAGQEWERVTRRYGMKAFPAAPAINMRPGSQGVDIVVRYITRASERYDMRTRLNRAVVKVLHQGKGAIPATENLPAS
jgi:small-conductance mechanosensitive channel